MLRLVPSPVADHPQWVEVSPEQPCPICGEAGGCSTFQGEELARCLRVVSDWPALSGGWLHGAGDLAQTF